MISDKILQKPRYAPLTCLLHKGVGPSRSLLSTSSIEHLPTSHVLHQPTQDYKPLPTLAPHVWSSPKDWAVSTGSHRFLFFQDRSHEEQKLATVCPEAWLSTVPVAIGLKRPAGPILGHITCFFFTSQVSRCQSVLLLARTSCALSASATMK